MATTKTITVTNQTVSVPEFTDRPDARVYSDAEGKCVDGINANTQAIAKQQESIAIVATGNTHAAIGIGQYVYVKEHGTLTEGMYKNLSGSPIAANATLSSSNLTSISGGAFNDIGALSENFNIEDTSVSDSTFTTIKTFSVPVNGNYIITVNAGFEAGSGIRILLVDVTETSSNNPRNSVLVEGRATLQKIMLLGLKTTDTIYVRAYQKSGSSMIVSGHYRYLKIR